MATQYLKVKFPKQRAVLVDNADVGDTNTVLLLAGDQYTVTLGGHSFGDPPDYSPASQDIALTGTSESKPLVIEFVPTVTLARPEPMLAAAHAPAVTKAVKTKGKTKTKVTPKQKPAAKTKAKPKAKRKQKPATTAKTRRSSAASGKRRAAAKAAPGAAKTSRPAKKHA